jgi:hypothetical protein
VQLEPSGIATVDINAGLDSLGIAPNATLSGWVELQYNWAWVPLCAMIRDLDATHSVVFTFGFAAPGPLSMQSQRVLGSQVREGMWWKQEKNVTGFVALANTTPKAIDAKLEVSDSHAAVLGSYSITVSPLGTKTVNLSELQSAADSQGGIRVSYVGAQDDLLVGGGLQDIGIGYSANVPFSASQRPLPPMAHATTPQSYVQLGLMAGSADQTMHFPSGTTFTPYSVLRNISATPISVIPTLWWMQGGVPAGFQLLPLRLLPYETHTLDVPSLMAAAGLKYFNGSVNLVLDTQGQKGLLMASGSVDQTNTYVFEVPPHAVLPSSGKSLSYWSTGNGDDTMVTLWNPADEEQNLIFRLVFAGGHYDLPILLGPRETRMFNISSILSGQGPDPNGNMIPAGVQEGSAVLVGSEADNQSVLVAVESGTYNVRKATCQQNCTSCNGTTSYWVASSPFGVAVGGQTQEYLQAQWNTGQQYDYTSGASWGSSNTSVATIPQPGLAHGVSGGDFTASASISSVPVYAQACNGYPSCPVAGGGGGQAPGVVPNITSIDPSSLALGASNVQVTISGSGFGSSPTVNLPSGVTINNGNQVSSDSQIVTYVNVAYTAAIGNNNISVTANGQKSNNHAVALDGPYSLLVEGDNTGYYNNNSANDVMRSVTYQIQNFSTTNAGATQICEIPNQTPSNPPCSPSVPGPNANWCPAVPGHTAKLFTTASNGMYTDDWSLANSASTFAPAGCGISGTDPWYWNPQSSTIDELGNPSGYIHTDAIEIYNHVSTPTNQNRLIGITMPK